MRNPIACIACRAAKRQCIHNDRPPCKRCKDRAEKCHFPLPGTSSFHRLPRVRHLDIRQETSVPNRTGDTAYGKIEKTVSRRLSTKEIDFSPYDLSNIDPFDLFTDEVKNSYLRCSYKWSFHHIPSLLIDVRNSSLDLGVMWAILALAIRFTTNVPPPYATAIEASNAFAAQARSVVLPSVELPTVSRIQALLMVTGHSWGAGEARQAWIYLGMAIRMAQILGLFEESHPSNSRQDFIDSEERRRTAWTCFLMDSLLSGGKRRVRALSIHDMRIQLPCDTDYFHFGEVVRCEMMDGSLPKVPYSSSIGNLGIVAYSMRVADIWGQVAKWACSKNVEGELPWSAESEFQQLLTSLTRWNLSLPRRFKFDIMSLHAHSASNQGQAYAYMHAISLMALMFLHRAYLPHSFTQNKHHGDSPLDYQWRQWQAQSRRELMNVTKQACEMFEEMRAFGLYFLRGLVPWNGYTVYTAAGIMLYFFHFPEEEDDDEVLRKCRDRVANGCDFLRDMKNSWPMADSWRETLKRMQIFYTNINTKGENSVTQSERKEMQNSLVDYGALHHTPVQGPSTIPGRSVDREPSSPKVQPSPSPNIQFDRISTQSFLGQHDFHLEGLDFFDTNFPINDAEVEAAIFNSTHDFWANFPGEVEMY